jgi:hypothetical protein
LDTVPLGQLEADDSAVNPKQKIQVGGLDVDVPDADLGIDRAGLSAVLMPYRPFLAALKAESRFRWMKTQPSISSPSMTAQPRPEARTAPS